MVNSGGMLVGDMAMLCNTQVNGGGIVFPNTIVDTIPRSLGFRNRRAATRINSGGGVHRGIAVGHNATTGKGAYMNDGGLLVRKIRITRSTVMNGNYVVNGDAGLTNRAVVSSGTVVDTNILVRRFYHMNKCAVINNNAHFDVGMPPFAVYTHRPTTCYNLGLMNLHHHNFDGRLVSGVRGTCQLVCRNNAPLTRTLGGVHRRVPTDPRVSCVIRFVRGSGQKFIRWSGCCNL